MKVAMEEGLPKWLMLLATTFWMRKVWSKTRRLWFCKTLENGILEVIVV